MTELGLMSLIPHLRGQQREELHVSKRVLEIGESVVCLPSAVAYNSGFKEAKNKWQMAIWIRQTQE